MRIIRPITVTDAVLAGCSIAETDHAAWSSGATYASGDRVILTSTHKIYESVQAGNTNQNPATDDGTWWVEISATKRWKLFDGRVGDPAQASNLISVTLEPGAVANAVAGFGMGAAAVSVVITDPVEGEVYNETLALTDNSAVTDYYAYFFEPIIRSSEFALWDLPPYPDATMVITATATGATVSIGELVLGARRDLGAAKYGTSVSILDYSRKDVDDFGVAYLLQRAFSYRVEFDVYMPVTAVRAVRNILSTLRATPLVWSGNPTGEDYGTLIYGFYRDFQIILSTPSISEATIQVEGIT